MDRHPGSALLFVLAALAACSNEPAAPDRSPDRPSAAQASGAQAAVQPAVAICEKNWLFPRDGDWNEPANWYPAGVPTIDDEVCITASVPDTMVITLSPNSEADSVYVGPGIHLTLVDTDLTVAEELVIDSGAELVLDSSVGLGARDVINRGTLTVAPWASFSTSGVVDNAGTLYLDGYLLSIGAMRNTGDIRVNNVLTLESSGDVEMLGGRVTGNGRIFVEPRLTLSPGRFFWGGGQLALRNPTTSQAQVLVRDMDVELGNTALSGALDIAPDSSTLTGHIGASVDVHVSMSGTPLRQALQLKSPSGGAVVNEGSIRINAMLPMVVSAPDGIVNRGTLRWVGMFQYFVTPSVVNHGSIDVQSDVEFLPMPNATFTTFGTLTVQSPGNLGLIKAQVVAAPGSVQTGSMRVSGSLSGGGRLGNVLGNGVTITPNGSGIGVLSFDALTLTSNDTLRLDVAGLQLFDRVRVAGEATYNGHLELVATPAFAPLAGTCGQVLGPITDGNSVTGHAPGAFRSFANTPGGLNRYWRAHYATDTVMVTGYDPTVPIQATLGGALVEGGAQVSGFVCLGYPPQGSATTATLAAAQGQFTASPSALTFTPSDWALPRTVRYRAVDDTRSEGPHGDLLTFSLAGGGAPWGVTPPTPRFAITDNDPAVDLTVALVSANGAVPAGQAVDRRFRVTNLGPGASTGATVRLGPLSGVAFVSSGGGVPCAMSGASLVCTIGPLASGASTEFVVLFTAPATAGSYTNPVQVKGRDWDNVPANDSFAWVLTVN